MASMMPTESKLNRRPAGEDPLDEACFLAELRLKVEGARTAAEEALARALPEWTDRLNTVCARMGR